MTASLELQKVLLDTPFDPEDFNENQIQQMETELKDNGKINISIEETKPKINKLKLNLKQ